AAPGAPTPRPPTAPPLGLGLGLGPRQRGAFQQAAQGGQGQQFLAARPWLQRRVNQLGPTSPQATRVQDFLATGQNQRPVRTPPNQTPGAFTPQPPAGPQPWNESVPPGTTPQIPGGPLGGGWSGDNASMQAGLAGQAGQQFGIGSGAMGPSFGPGGPYGGGGMLGGMQGQLGGMYGGGFDQNAINANPGGFQQWMQGARQQEARYPGSTMLGGMQGQLGGLYGGFSPQMQQVLQARYGGFGGGGGGGGQYGGMQNMYGGFGGGKGYALGQQQAPGAGNLRPQGQQANQQAGGGGFL